MDVWRNSKEIEELRQEIADLRKLVLKTVEHLREKKTPPPAPIEVKREEDKKKKAWF